MGIVPLYVWGHFQSADNRDRLVARSEQPVLPEAIEERKKQLRRLQDQDPYFLERIFRLFRIFKVVYCPSTPRHIESAKLICEMLRLPPPIPDARLNNVDYGNFKGQPSSNMRPRHEYLEIRYPGGDSWLDCLGRWRSFFEEVLPRYNGQPVLLAGQAGAAIRMCAHLCEGMRLSDAVDLELTDRNVPWVYFYKF
ncbi:MAG TPA: histidine phosphatase family protein [Candidatus Binatia bacterium]|nr:histidine phosphatase family protein [Candidatus Binatia bacterium]